MRVAGLAASADRSVYRRRARMRSEANYTSGVIPSLQNLDWHGFLDRPAVPSPSPEALDSLRRQSILITGAGGSIGSALAFRLGRLGAQKLVFLEASESNLYALQRDWAPAGVTCDATFILGGIADTALLEEIFALHEPRIVFHAAAFKHVPLMEEQPLAAISNNIFATEALTRVAAAHSARVVLLSTDKAVAPASVMGATKRVAEQIVLASGGTALRLGNVLASRDSVAEIFAQQIAQGGPLTVTDPLARRYFLTVEEAVNLLLAAAALSGQALLAPVLPATHSIAELARFMARELSPGRELAIEFTSPRTGDKETEVLWSAAEHVNRASHDEMVLIETPLPEPAELASRLANLRLALEARDLRDALKSLRTLVSDYRPSNAVLALAEHRRPQACA